MHTFTARPRPSRWTRIAAVAFVLATIAGGLVEGTVGADAAPPDHAKGGKTTDSGEKCHPKRGCTTSETTGESAPAPSSEPTSDPVAEADEPTSQPADEPTSEPTSEPAVEETPEPTPEPTDDSSADPTASDAPDTQGTWTSPEGVTVDVATSGDWTIRDVYGMLLAHARDLDRIGPHLSVRVQDTYNTQAVSSWSGSGERFAFASIIYLKGVGSDTFVHYPHHAVAHEYGHTWSTYWVARVHDGAWADYHRARGLEGDSRLETSYSWQTAEIIADDYRLLFGAPESRTPQSWHLNSDIAHPNDVSGLASYLTGPFTGR